MTQKTTIWVPAGVHAELPTVPNYLIIERDPSQRAQDRKLKVGEFTDEALEEIGRAWTSALIAKAEEQRNAAQAERRGPAE